MEPSPSKCLKIAIPCIFQNSVFSSGVPTVAITLAHIMEQLGHTPILLHTIGPKQWYDDCESIRSRFRVESLQNVSAENQYDILIDIDGYLHHKERRRVAKQVVVFLRKPVALHEFEHTIYPIPAPIRNIEDCDAIWMWDHFGNHDQRIAECLSRKPVYRIPFVWSELGCDALSDSYPHWIDVSRMAPPNHPWVPHIIETNQSVGSSCTLPIVQIAYAKTHTNLTLTDYFVHNSETIQNHAFFKENVQAHCVRAGLQPHLVGRQRIGDWRNQPYSFVLSHMRFNLIKGAHLDCAWNGIPIIHNSPILRDLGHGLERFYYEDNSVTGAAEAMKRMQEDFQKEVGFFAPGNLERLRVYIQTNLGPGTHREIWERAVLFQPPLTRAVSAPSPPKPIVSPLPPKVIKSTEPIKTTKPTKEPKRVIWVGFSDLWQDANPTYNFWTLLLQDACRHMNPPVQIEAVEITDVNVDTPIDCLIFAPFSDTWTRVPTSVPKIHITGENTSPIQRPDVVLNLGFTATDLANGILRFPLWMQYIDWFGADQDRLRNPRTMPIDCFTSISKEALTKKDKFCAFIVSNPTNPIRNAAFQWLHSYKHVDSAGRLFNNVGDAIFTGTGGGGGGELKKLEFLQPYQFCLTYENNRADGYVTEKCLAAKAAGCVPIYWGAPNVTEDFAEGSFLNANDFTEPNQLIEAVQALETNQEAWLAMASKPCFSIPTVRSTLATVAKTILGHVCTAEQVSNIPSMLGAGSTEDAKMIGKLIEGDSLTQPGQTEYMDTPLSTFEWNQKTLLVTCATERFLPSLQTWLESVQTRIEKDSNLSARVYLGEDVNQLSFNVLRVEHPTVTFVRLPTQTVQVEGFPDLWEPQHFAWKLWIYQDLVRTASLANSLIWYMDAGSCIVRMPSKWLTEASTVGICMLEDEEQYNYQWCHEKFCKTLAVTHDELSAHQVVGGIMAFVVGAPLAWKVFSEAWTYAQQRDVIIGPKWGGIRPDGKPFGHRHDQSILSVLRLRHKVPVQPLSTVYNHESLRRTYKSGAALYVHRGTFRTHTNFANRIGEVHLINLTRRVDRIQRFKSNHGPWTKEVCLRPAYDGRAMKLSPALAKLFVPNDFKWKKAIMGCALSHLSLWVELAQEAASCENYLILEDDVKFQANWHQVWEQASKTIPDDYDVLYLGGVLPPNRDVFKQSLEQINEHWARVAPNKIFGQAEPTRYFHFCNYAYILSRKGAQKILNGLTQRGGYYTSADHMICNRVEDMIHYVLTPQVAGCYQDDDPAYQTSAFNDYSRLDKFDSDLWNNNDVFLKDEVVACLQDAEEMFGKEAIPVLEALHDGRIQVPSGQLETNSSAQLSPSTRFFTVGEPFAGTSLMEHKWLRSILGESFSTVETLPLNHTPLDNTPIFIVMRPYCSNYIHTFAQYEAAGKSFFVIHMSDEHLKDPIDWYFYSTCKGVVRNYIRPDCSHLSKVLTIPLGPHHFPEHPVSEYSERPLAWSFFGTNWMNRAELLTPLQSIQPNQAVFFAKWSDSNQLSGNDYSSMCLHSVFMPCPRGQNLETFRFYEALEHGAIPVLVREPGDAAQYTFLTAHLPILSAESWEAAAQSMQQLLDNPKSLALVQETLRTQWAAWKQELQTTIQTMFGC